MKTFRMENLKKRKLEVVSQIRERKYPTPTPTPTEPEVAPPTLGVNASYIGFGASTGGSTDEHWIHNFQFTSTLPQQSINYNNFYNNSTLVNNASKSDGSIRLTQASGNQKGTVFYNNPVGLLLDSGVPNDWSVFFEFSIGGGAGFADGISFILQSNTLNTGGLGGGIGYAGIPNSVAVSYDTWVNFERPESQEARVPHVEINVNGSVISVASTTTALPVSLRGSTGTGSRRYTWIDYTNQAMRVYLSDTNTKPGSPILTHNINVGDYIVL